MVHLSVMTNLMVLITTTGVSLHRKGMNKKDGKNRI